MDSTEPGDEADDFDRQVRETLAHWPGVTAVDLDDCGR